MPFTPEQLTAKLEAANVQFTQHHHVAVMTVDAMEHALEGVTGAVIKNMFLKDKKGRLYIVSAVHSTKVDMAVLSARLGMGKGGLRFAPEEALDDVLHVPLGSVTPLAVVNSEAAQVLLLLDHKIQIQEAVLVHPLTNTSTLRMVPSAFLAAIRAIGREPLLVDLEADPKIDLQNPPDLAQYVMAAPTKTEAPTASSGSAASASTQANGNAAASSTAATPIKGKKEAGGKASKAAAPVISEYEQQQAYLDVSKITQQLLQMMSESLLGGPLGEKTAAVDPYILRRLAADMEAELSSIKNASYAMGYAAGKGEIVAFAQRQFS
eukprot:CAMPEP_0119103434 /NCGR_PEP_ID=MMETSP1180-20130426/1865_1 /TAXON_ID=3052 ORGANISM="Chlamydomonas cf sp, Strain CCMP681" /NCGR_SAMPLE_ID=MMETSP1180 /ASSEMBLY_ACC=CAM_ASM_000741 /LENGTH=321 /DNA_ID=CAMNT_0007087931 /DNA_START=41 /DNA_END=1006 /DNA_ORIENTATION=-